MTRIVKLLHSDTHSAAYVMRVGNQIGLNVGVKQGCVMAAFFFILVIGSLRSYYGDAEDNID